MVGLRKWLNGFDEGGGVKIVKITPTIASYDTYEGSVKRV